MTWDRFVYPLLWKDGYFNAHKEDFLLPWIGVECNFHALQLWYGWRTKKQAVAGLTLALYVRHVDIIWVFLEFVVTQLRLWSYMNCCLSVPLASQSSPSRSPSLAVVLHSWTCQSLSFNRLRSSQSVISLAVNTFAISCLLANTSNIALLSSVFFSSCWSSSLAFGIRSLSLLSITKINACTQFTKTCYTTSRLCQSSSHTFRCQLYYFSLLGKTIIFKSGNPFPWLRYCQHHNTHCIAEYEVWKWV